MYAEYSQVEAAALSMRSVLRWIKSKYSDTIVVDSETHEVVHSTYGSHNDCSLSGLTIEECNSYFSLLAILQCHFVILEVNIAAQKLATPVYS